MKTYSPKPADIERRWFVVDADGAVLGRLASEVAKILRGKHKPIFAPHSDTGDYVIVVNAGRVRLTGGKEDKKVYYRHSGYPGGLREIGYRRLLSERPVVAVEKAVRGMLPKNHLGRKIFTKLSVHEGPEHPHKAQRPEPLAIGQVPAWSGLPTPSVKAEAPAKEAERPRVQPGAGVAPRAEAWQREGTKRPSRRRSTKPKAAAPAATSRAKSGTRGTGKRSGVAASKGGASTSARRTSSSKSASSSASAAKRASAAKKASAAKEAAPSPRSRSRRSKTEKKET